MEEKYYLYRHIRQDKNVPFYIGVGTKQSKGKLKSIYARAYAKEKGRNKWWKNIVDKTDYKIEIILESNDLEFIKSKEIEFIELYKETLCNITKGGDNISPKCKNEVYQYSLEGNFIQKFESANEAARILNISTSSLNRCLIGKRKSNNLAGFQWFYKYKGKNIPSIILGKTTMNKKVILYNDTEKYIFNNRKECAKFIKRSPARVTDLIKIGTFKTYKIKNHGI